MILGIDPGERRVGVAIADRATRWARPLEVIDTRKTDPSVRVAELVREHAVDLIVVGRPIGLSGKAGPAIEAQQQLVEQIKSATEVPVAEHDERLTTAEADRSLRDAGVKAGERKRLRDAVAAQLMLQAYVDTQS